MAQYTLKSGGHVSATEDTRKNQTDIAVHTENISAEETTAIREAFSTMGFEAINYGDTIYDVRIETQHYKAPEGINSSKALLLAESYLAELAGKLPEAIKGHFEGYRAKNRPTGEKGR